MKATIQEAEHGLKEGGIPIGAVPVYTNPIIGRGDNRRVRQGSVILHARRTLSKCGPEGNSRSRRSTLRPGFGLASFPHQPGRRTDGGFPEEINIGSHQHDAYHQAALALLRAKFGRTNHVRAGAHDIGCRSAN